MSCKIIQKADRPGVVADLTPAVDASVLAVERPCGVLPAEKGGMGGMQENNRVLVEAPAVQSRQNPAEVGDAARHPHQKQLKKSVGRIRIPAVKAQKSPDRPGVADRAEDQTVARLWRQGQESGTVVVQHILAAGTVDERIMKALSAKDAIQAKLIEAVKAEVTVDGGN